MQETNTRSPTLTRRTDAPTAVTVPTASWPSIRPSVTAGRIAFEDMEVGTADGGGLNVNDGVGLVDDDWIISVFPRTVPRAVVNQCFHLGCRDRDGG